MSEVPERVISRIRKMLRLAQDAAASQGERDNAMRMVHATLAKYNLDLASIDSTTPDKPAGVEPRHEERSTFYGRPWARLVAQGVAELLFCRYLFARNTRAKDTVHVFIGSHSNSVTASLMAEFLIESVMREGRRKQREAQAGNTWFRSFATAAAARIVARCIVLRTSPGGAASGPVPSPPATSPGPGSAIVLATVYEREAAANAAHVARLAPGTVDDRARLKRRINLDAAEEGFAYGGRVSLDRQIK